MKKRLEYLTKKLKNVDFETKYRKSFEKEARYQGNGIYFWHKRSVFIRMFSKRRN